MFPSFRGGKPMTNETQRDDRRRGYSLGGHFRRLKQSGRLKQVGGVLAVAFVIAGITFARCQSSKITGPSAPTPAAGHPSGPSAHPTTTVAEKKATTIFPSDLLPAIHPCDPTTSFTEGGGSADFYY